MILLSHYITSDEFLLYIVVSFILVIAICMFLLFLSNKYYKNQQTFLLEKTSYQKQLLEVQSEVKEEILQHVSREIHDNLGQMASLIKINLQAIQLEKDADKSQRILLETTELVKNLATDMKGLSVSLHSDFILVNDLVSAIQKETERVSKMELVKIDYQHQGNDLELENNTALFLYRIFQEMLNNTLKHAHSTQVNIITSFHNNIFMLKYNDNGKGFDHQAYLFEQKASGSSGIRNMKERCKLIGASFTINSISNLGTEIIIQLEIS